MLAKEISDNQGTVFIYAAFKETNVDGGKNGPGYGNEECKSDPHALNINQEKTSASRSQLK